MCFLHYSSIFRQETVAEVVNEEWINFKKKWKWNQKQEDILYNEENKIYAVG